MAKLKIPLVILLITALIVPYVLYSDQASAQNIGDSFVGGISCIVGGTLAPWLSTIIRRGLNALRGALGLKIEGWLGLTNTVPVIDQEAYTKERTYDMIARCVAREVLNNTTARMIGAIRTSGRNGGPAFVRNWRNFKLDAQHRGENIFRSILGSTQLCPYISGNIKSLFNAQASSSFIKTRVNNLDPYTLRARCTMPIGWNIQNYQADFAGNGGWSALTRLSEPQNNFYGNFLMSLSEVSVQRLAEEDSDLSSVVAGLGFDSRRGKSAANNCLLTASNGRCIVYKDILTPGSVLQQNVSAVIQQELAWITNVDELSEMMSILTNLLLSRVLNLSTPNDTDQEPYDLEIYPGPDPDPNPDFGIPDPGGGAPEPEPIEIPEPTACVDDCTNAFCRPPNLSDCEDECGSDSACIESCLTSGGLICPDEYRDLLNACYSACYDPPGSTE